MPLNHDHHPTQAEATPLLDLLQLADSSFPSGSYAHSFGLEWLDRQGDLDLETVLRVRLAEAITRLELPLVREAYQASDVQTLLELDHLLDVLTPVRELREASRSIGRGFLRAALKLRPSELLSAAAARGASHQPIVHGAVLRQWGLPLVETLSIHALQAVRQQLSAAQRLGRIGQSTAQELLHQLKPAIRAAVDRSLRIPIDEAGAFSPWLDLAGMKHEQQFARVFQS